MEPFTSIIETLFAVHLHEFIWALHGKVIAGCQSVLSIPRRSDYVDNFLCDQCLNPEHFVGDCSS